MKEVIRQNCFETNSSSQHVIVMTKNDKSVSHDVLVAKWSDENHDPFESIYLDGKNELDLRDTEYGFGRSPFRILSTFEDKLRYALCEFCGYYYGDEDEFTEEYQKIEDVVREIIPEMTKFDIYTKDLDIYLDDDGNELKHYKDLHYDHWDEETHSSFYYYIGADGEHHMAHLDEENYLEVPNIGEIDHQSAGLLKNFLNKKGISLKEFLTNKKYIVVVDGDEICAWDQAKASGIINLDYIVEEYGDSGEDVEYQEWLKEQEENETSNKE